MTVQKAKQAKRFSLRYYKYAKLGLVNLALVGITGVSTQAFANTDSAISRMESDMRAMQTQIQQLKQKQEIENRRVRAQLERQRLLLEASPYNTHDRMVEGDDLAEISGVRNNPSAYGSTTTGLDKDILGIELEKLAKPRVGDTPFSEVTATPPTHPDLYGPLRRGQLQIGDARITLGGFFEAAGIWRSSDQNADIWTPLNAVPFNNSPLSHINEFNETARASRLSVLIEGMITKKLEADAYLEVDFGASGSSANSRATNSYSPRIRVGYGELKDYKGGWYVLAGQNWSLLTLSHNGMWGRNEQIPLTIDQAYVAGFNYTRNTQFRLVKMFKDNLYGVGISVESPSSVLQGSSNNKYGTLTSVPGSGLNNPNTYYATDTAPDVVGKVTADPKWGHFEISGVMRFFHDRSNAYAPTGGSNHTRIGGGLGGGMVIPFFHNKLNFRASGLAGYGIGRYGASGLPDYTLSARGAPQALPEASFMFGAFGRPLPRLQLYSYAGMDTVRGRVYNNVTGGYGNPNFDMSGCNSNNPTSVCQAGDNLNYVAEATGGFWYTVFKGDYGSVLTGAQYAHIQAKGYSGKGGHGLANEDMVFFSLRYLPFS